MLPTLLTPDQMPYPMTSFRFKASQRQVAETSLRDQIGVHHQKKNLKLVQLAYLP